MSDYYDGLNLKLLDAIPADAKRVLELGCANGRLGRRFKELHPGVTWWGVEMAADAAATAAHYLDRVVQFDLDRADLTQLDGGFDTIVIGDLLEHVREPGRLLESLYDLATPGAQIVCCLPNMAHLSVIERMVAGDISYDSMGLLDATHVRFYSPASAFKTFLDAGWLPDLSDQHRVELPRTPFAAKIVEAAQLLGVPAETATRNLGCYQMIIVCRKWTMEALHGQRPSVPISVIVPVNRPWQYELNIARSPGLKEIGAEIIPVQGADSAAAAYTVGTQKAHHAWRLLVHQDVYFPTGSGFALARELGALEAAGRTRALVGFAGLASSGAADGSVRYAGLVIDRTHLFQHPGADAAMSSDEFAIAMHRDAAVSIDSRFGWHLWATDLCLQTWCRGNPNDLASIVEVPLFHNSTTAFSVPETFRVSAQRLLDKYPALGRIPTLCGELQRSRRARQALA
ncbi:MAG TPA: methyltransferase domain-containing protein [Rubrivivax sp.]|nr:methyltransferase domain-containing protein [Rubrivivax sp.]